MRSLVAGVAGLTRAGRDRAFAASGMPAATREVTVEGLRGWLYPVTSERGERFELFAWFDGSAYQVRVVSPDVWGRADLHACHLFRDARICLGAREGGGMSTLQGAYARSVVWANGFSEYRRSGRFPLEPRQTGG
jgi:hypothetical protein